MSSIVKVDTIQENTSANGITVDGLNIKDSKLVTANSVVAANVTADAINATKIADGSIENEHLNVLAVTGQTAETSIADGDTILIHDASASALRKMTKANFVSGIGGANTPAFAVKLDGDQSISNQTWTKIAFASEDLDTDNKFASNRFTPTTAGWYNIQLQLYVECAASQMNEGVAAIYKNGSDVANARADHRNNRGQGAGINVSYILYLDSNDYIEGYAYLDGFNSFAIKTFPGTLMSGYRIII